MPAWAGAGPIAASRHSFVISCRRPCYSIISPMPQVSARPHIERAPRVKLGGSVLALIVLENRRQIRANLHQLSVNGGMLKLEKALDEKIAVNLVFHLGATTIRAKAEMLFPMWATNGWLQPFRFLDLPEEDAKNLDIELSALL